MASRTRMLLGLIAAALLIGGAAWASGESSVETNVVDRTVIPVDPAGEVTLEVVSAGLSIVTVEAEPGWTVVTEAAVGREVEVRLVSDRGRIDFNAELEDGEIRVEIERRLQDDSSTTTVVTTPSTSSSTTPSTSTTVDDDGTTSTSVGSAPSTSTTIDDSPSTTGPSTTSTTLDDDHDDATTSTSTTIDDDVVDIPDGTRTFDAGAAGSITVGIRSGSLSLVSVNANSGWSYEIDKARSDDIEVEFTQGDADVEIRVRIHDGRLEARLDD
ncbi:MAG TPA: hypothetical protein VF377_01165 [Acidimicrobiia bacterium]